MTETLQPPLPRVQGGVGRVQVADAFDGAVSEVMANPPVERAVEEAASRGLVGMRERAELRGAAWMRAGNRTAAPPSAFVHP